MADKKWLASLAGLLDPALIRVARKLAEDIPPDSPLRSQLVEAMVGALRGFVESNAEKFPALAAVTVEKLTDLSDFFSAALAQGDGPGGSKKLLDDFLAETALRLKKAADPKEEADRIKEELALLLEIISMARKKETADEPSQLVPVLEDVNRRLAGVRDRLAKKKEV